MPAIPAITLAITALAATNSAIEARKQTSEAKHAREAAQNAAYPKEAQALRHQFLSNLTGGASPTAPVPQGRNPTPSVNPYNNVNPQQFTPAKSQKPGMPGTTTPGADAQAQKQGLDPNIANIIQSITNGGSQGGGSSLTDLLKGLSQNQSQPQMAQPQQSQAPVSQNYGGGSNDALAQLYKSLGIG